MTPRRARRSELAALSTGIVLACAAGVGALWAVFVRTLAGRRVDQLAMIGALHGRSTLWRYAERVLDPVSVAYGVVVLVVVVGIAVLRRRFRLAGQAALLFGGAMLTTELLKRVVLGRPDLGDLEQYGNTMPSGHTTAAAATSAALLFVVPPRGRPAVAVLGAAYTVATGWATLIGQWHRPADVVAAVLVVTGWFALAALLMLAGPVPEATATTALPLRRRRGVAAGRTVVGLVVVGAGALAVAVVALGSLWGGRGTPGTRGQLVAYGGGVVAIVAAVALGVAVQLALREAVGGATRDPAPPGRRADAAAGTTRPTT